MKLDYDIIGICHSKGPEICMKLPSKEATFPDLESESDPAQTLD